MKQKENGFSLIELLIVVVTIGIVASIAVPNLLAVRRSANEASTIATARSVGTAQLMFYSTTGGSTYGTTNELYRFQLIGVRTAAAGGVNVGGIVPTNHARDGYKFRIQQTDGDAVAGTPSTYVFSAIPATTTGVTKTGTHRYCMTEAGLIKSATTSLTKHYNYNQCTNASPFAP